MKQLKTITLYCVVVLLTVSLFGCGGKADENKPMDEVKAEAEKMDVAKLKAMAAKYKDAIMAKQKDIEKMMAKLKEIPVTDMMSKEATGLKADIDSLNKSLSNLKVRFQVYYDKLKEKGGDISGLEL
jgi:predicted  nucleic acid-binding Zn-ribbon protein